MIKGKDFSLSGNPYTPYCSSSLESFMYKYILLTLLPYYLFIYDLSGALLIDKSRSRLACNYLKKRAQVVLMYTLKRTGFKKGGCTNE